MKFKLPTYTATVALLAVLGIPVGLVAQEQQRQNAGKPPHYTITDLGTLGGTFSEGVGIDDGGLVSGNSTLPGDTVAHAFIWQKGAMTDLGTLGGPNSNAPEAWPPSNRGDVPGFSDTLIVDPNGEDFCAFVVGGGNTDDTCVPLMWHDDQITPLALLGGNNGMANAVNNRGELAGVAETNIPDPNCSPPLVLHFEPVIWRNSAPHQLPLFNGDSDGFVQGINDRGQAVGWTGPCFPVHAVLWENGEATDLGNLGGAAFNIAYSINNRGQIVGQSDLPGNAIHHAFLWQNGVMRDLGTLPGLPNSLAFSINNKGQVVGFSQDLNGDISSTVAWIWQDGVMTNLNTLIPSDSPYFLIEALSINDQGQVAGFMFDSSAGVAPGFVATPVEANESNVEDTQNSATMVRAPVVLPENICQLLRDHARFGRGLWATARNSALNATTVTSVPIATLSPTSLAFSTEAIGTASPAKNVTLKNTGTASLSITSIAITGTNAGDFAQIHNCGSSLAAGVSCTISLTFKPTSSGTRTAVVSITDNAAGSPQKVSLAGIGTTAKLSPTKLNFGTVAIGTTSPTKSVTLTNLGTSNMTISGIVLTGINARDFVQTHNCGSSLAPGAPCTINVTFKPTVSATRTATLSVSDSAAGSPQTVALTGIGTTAKLSPTTLSFGSLTIGRTSSPQTVTLTNVGAISMNITAIAISGTDPGDFAQTHTCGNSLAADVSCTINITFKPTESGTRTAALSVTDNVAGSPQTAFLSGNGVESLEITSDPPPSGTVGINYESYLRCGWSPVLGWHLVCSPCDPSVAGSCPLRSCPTPIGTECHEFIEFRFTATGGVPPYIWSASGMPPGLTLDPSSGQINGVPTMAGSYHINVVVKDSESPPAPVSTTYIIDIGG